MPHDFPPWAAVHQQSQRWIKAGCFEAMAHDLCTISRVLQGRDQVSPTAMVMDSRTVQSTPESGGRAGYDGYKRRKGTKLHIAVDSLGHLLALHVTPASDQDRAQAGLLAARAQEATGKSIEVAYVDQAYTGEECAGQAAEQGIRLEVVKLAQARHGFVLLPHRWLVERSFAWVSRFRRLARDYERLSSSFAAFHWLAFAGLILASLASLPSA